MKKLIGLLVILLIFTMNLGIFFSSESSFMNVFYKEFDTTINITTNPQSIDDAICEMQKIAKKNNISFIKEAYEPKNTRYEKEKLIIYTYLDEVSWFEQSFKNIDIIEDGENVNKFKKLKSISFLTTKDINLLPFSDIDQSFFNGDYHIKGSIGNVQKFLNDLNDINIESKIDTSFTIASEFTQKQLFLYIVSTIILVTSLIFCLVIYNGSLSKEIAIVNLLGYDKRNFCINKTFKLLRIPLLISVGLLTGILYYLIKPTSLKSYVFSSSKIYTLIILIVLILFMIEYILLQRKTKNIDIVAWLKGYRKNYNKSSVFVKTCSIAVVLYLMIISISGLGDYLALKPHIKTWEKSKNYANIACTWSWSYVEDDEKFQNVVVPKLNNLWNELENNGAILFDAPNVKQEGVFYDEDYVKKQAFNGKYAYINENYLKFAQLVDSNGRNIEGYNVNEGEWIVFIPENMEISKADKERIKEDHKNKLVSNKINTKEIYVPIKKDQNIFSFDSQKRLDEPDTNNYALIMVNGKELEPTGSIKLPSLVNGKFHPYISDGRNAYKNLQNIIEKTESKPYILYITSVYDEVVSKIELFKIESFIYMVALFLSLLILGALLEIDKESYFYNHGKRIDVSRLLGYDFLGIHKKKLLQNLISYLASIILLMLVIFLTANFSQYGFFTPRDGWTRSKLYFNLLLSFICITICFIIEIKKLKKADKSIVIRLKEGC